MELPKILGIALGGLVSYIMWFGIAKPFAKWILSRIPPGPLKTLLTKDMGGDY